MKWSQPESMLFRSAPRSHLFTRKTNGSRCRAVACCHPSAERL